MFRRLAWAAAALGCAVLAAFVPPAWPNTADAPRGAAEIELDGGKRGAVGFPHRRHQQRLTDCGICHAVFPQQKGAIQALKAAGKLKPKQVMNKQCTACHRKMKRAGQKTGPTACTSCHRKSG